MVFVQGGAVCLLARISLLGPTSGSGRNNIKDEPPLQEYRLQVSAQVLVAGVVQVVGAADAPLAVLLGPGSHSSSDREFAMLGIV